MTEDETENAGTDERARDSWTAESEKSAAPGVSGTPTLESALERAEADPASLTAADALTVLQAGTVTEILEFRDGFIERATEDPDLVREVTAGMSPEAFEAEDRERRNTAAQFVTALAREHRGAAAPATEALISLLDDEYALARKSAAEALQWIGGEEPERLLPAVEYLPGLFESDLPQTRQTAVVLAWEVAGTDASALAPILDALLGVLEEEVPEADPSETLAQAQANREQAEAIRDHHREMQQDVRQARERTGVVIAGVADAAPGAVAARVDGILSILDGESDPVVQGSLVEAVGIVAQHDPDPVAESGVAPVAGDLLDHEDRGLAAKAAWTLAMLAERYPDPVREATLPRIEAVRVLLDEEEAWSRGTAASLLGYLADSDPEAVDPARERLIELLDDEAAYVRGSAAMTLGDLGEETVREKLETMAAEDPDEEVRSAAAAALERL
jgi:HEAT repeat protein